MKPVQAWALRRMQGQALVLGMVLAALAALALLRFFAAGQVVAAKARQTHALDAATYSGALIQARALNMLGYLNRTHIAHQVAMAHAVTLGSWALFASNQGNQLSRSNPPPHIIGMFFGPAHGAAYLGSANTFAMQGMAQPHGSLAAAFSRHSDIVHGLLSRVQKNIVHTLPEVRLKAMQQVLEHNYADTKSDLRLVYDTWPDLIQLQTPPADLAPLLAKAAQQFHFLQSRDHTARSPVPVDGRCPSWRHELRRRGATHLDSEGQWQSIDTQSFHAVRSNRWILCYFREYPMGWGVVAGTGVRNFDAPHVQNPPPNFSSQDFWRWVQAATDWDIFSGKANPLANSFAIANRPRWHGGGLASYYDVATSIPATQRTAQFTAQLRRPGPEGLTVTTTSSAEAFFQRPVVRDDLKHEAPNLFHPYWQARLSTGVAAVKGLLP